MRPNALRDLMNAGQGSLGSHVASPWPSVVELLGYTGQYDYVEFVAEYAPYDLFSLDNLGRAVDLFPHMSAMIKLDQVKSK